MRWGQEAREVRAAVGEAAAAPASVTACRLGAAWVSSCETAVAVAVVGEGVEGEALVSGVGEAGSRGVSRAASVRWERVGARLFAAMRMAGERGMFKRWRRVGRSSGSSWAKAERMSALRSGQRGGIGWWESGCWVVARVKRGVSQGSILGMV